MKYLASLHLKTVFKFFSFSAQAIKVLDDCSYRFFSNTSYAITGQSGSGKSTLLHLLAGFDSPTKGLVTYNSQKIINLSSEQKSKAISFVVQNPTLIAECSVIENCALASLIAGESWQYGLKKAKKLLDQVGLIHTCDWHVGQLSGGQKQRVALVRALITKPHFLLADELTGNLDPETGVTIINFVIKYVKEHKMGFIISTHNPEIAEKMDLVLSVEHGKLVAQNKEK